MVFRITLGILVIFVVMKSILSEENIQVQEENILISTTEDVPFPTVERVVTQETKNFSTSDQKSLTKNDSDKEFFMKSNGSEMKNSNEKSAVSEINTKEELGGNIYLTDMPNIPTGESNKRIGDVREDISSHIATETGTSNDTQLTTDSYYPDLPSKIGISDDTDFGIQYIYSYDSDVPKNKKIEESREITDYDYSKEDTSYEEPRNILDSLTRAEGTQKVTIVKQKSVHSVSREEKNESVNVQNKNPEPRLSNDEDIEVIQDHQAIRSETSAHPNINQNEESLVFIDESQSQTGNNGFHGSSYDEHPNTGAFIKPGDISDPSSGVQFNNHGDGISTQYFLTKHNNNAGSSHPLSDSSIGQTNIGSKYVPSPHSQSGGDLGDFNNHLSGNLQGDIHASNGGHGVGNQQGGNVVIVHKVDPNQIYIDEKTGNMIKFVTDDGGAGNSFHESSKNGASGIDKHSQDLLNNFGVKNSHSSQGLFPPSGGVSLNPSKSHNQGNGGGNIKFHDGSSNGGSHHHHLLQTNGNSQKGNTDNPVDYIVLCDGKGKIDYDNSQNDNDFGKKLNFGGQNSGNKGNNFKIPNSGLFQGGHKGTQFQTGGQELNLGGGNFGSKQGNSNFKGVTDQVHVISTGDDKTFGGIQHGFPSGGNNQGSGMGVVQWSGQKGTSFPNAGIPNQNNNNIHFVKMQNNFKGTNMNAMKGQNNGVGVGGWQINNGMQGAKGWQINNGMQGAKGWQINNGMQGGKGWQNNNGMQGAKGWQVDEGVPGANGWQINEGMQGEKGWQVDEGVQGAKGWQINNGMQGAKGWQLNNGMQGAKGWQVDEGVQGAKGWQMNNGMQGAKGWQINGGIQGEKGWQMNNGMQGANGWQINEGIQGEKGWQVDEGVQGAKGWQMNNGMQGTKGWQINNGMQGAKGWQINNGMQGAKGWQGNEGGQEALGNAKGTPFPMLNGGNNNGFSKGDNSLNLGNSKGTSFLQLQGMMNINNHQKGTSIGNQGIGIQHIGQAIHNALKSNMNGGNFKGHSNGGHNMNDFQNHVIDDSQMGLHPSFGGMNGHQLEHSMGGGQNQPQIEWILVDLDQGNGKKSSGGGDNKVFIQYEREPNLSAPQSYMSYMSGIGGHSYSGGNGWNNMYQMPKLRSRMNGGKKGGRPMQQLLGHGMGGPGLIQLQNPTPKSLNGNIGTQFHKRTGNNLIPQIYIQKRSDVKSSKGVK